MSEPSTPRRVRFGVFDLDTETGELRKSGVRLKLQDQPFQILRELVLDPGELVARERLQEKLWPGETFVDFDHSLNAAVKKLRDVLGDDARSPRFIETLPKKGYRFIAPVEVIEGGSFPRGRWVSAGLGVAALAAAVYLVWPPPEPEALRLVDRGKLTYSPGDESAPSLSPDGTRVAYSWQEDIWIRQVDGSSAPIQVTDTPEEEVHPDWSPDGTKLVFARIVKFQRPPYQVDAHLVRVSPAPDAHETKIAEISGRGRAFGPAWSPDGEHIAFSCRTGGEDDIGPSRICIYSFQTGKLQAVTPPGPTIGDFVPVFAPDGRSIAYRSGPGLAVSKLTKDMQPEGEPIVVAENLSFPRPAGWLRESGEILYTLSPNYWMDERGVWAVAPKAGAESRLLWRGSASEADAWEGTGGELKIAYAEETHQAQIVRVDLSAQAPRDPAPFTPSTGLNFSPQFAPDGRRVAFLSNRTGPDGVWLCKIDDCDNPDPLVEFPFAGLSIPMWSPTGDRILVDAIFRVKGRQAYMVDVASRRVGPSLTGGPNEGGGRFPAWTRDRESFYSTGGGPPSVWKQSLETGVAKLFLPDYGNGPVAESPDAAFLYLIHGRDLMRVSLNPEGEVQGEPERVAEEVGAFAPVRRGVYYRELAGPVWFRATDHSEPRKVADAPPVVGSLAGAGIAVSPDERWLLYTDRKPAEVDLKLLESVE